MTGGDAADHDRGAVAAAKRHAGTRAARTVESGQVVGLGTGSTAAHGIRALGERVETADLQIKGIPTSFQARQLAIASGIDLVEPDEVAGIDVAIDGADQVATGTGDLIKGGGAAHAREKVVAAAADRFLVVIDARKEVEELAHPVPLEVLPVARSPVADAIRGLGGEPTLRSAHHKDGPVVTDNGNVVLDCDFGTVTDPGALAADLAALPGVVEHGLFVDMAHTGYVGTEDGVSVREW